MACLLALSLSAIWSCSDLAEEGPMDPRFKVVTPRPDTTKPDTTKPDTTKPDTTKPDTTKPDTTKPDTTKPDTTKPDTTKPDTTKPDTTKPDINNSDTTALQKLLGALADTGIAAGLESIRAQGFDKDVDPVWKTTASESTGYSYSIRQYGLFKRIHVVSRVRAGTFRADKRAAARAGHVLGLDAFPSLGVLAPGSNLGLALDAEVAGPVYIPNGVYRFMDDYAVRYRGSIKTLTVWNKDSEFAKLMPFTFAKTRTWVKDGKRQVADLGSSPAPAADPEWETTEVFEGGKVLSGRTWDGAKLLCPGRITLGAGAVLKDCLIMASEIRIEGNAQVSGLAFASGAMTVAGQPSLKGQFIAGDSLRIDIASPLSDYPVFYVQGQDTVGSRSGQLDIVRATGQGVFLYSGDSLGVNLYLLPASITLGPETDLQGFAYTRGMVGVSGRFRGSVIGKGPAFYKDPTIYTGILGGGNLGLAPAGTAFPFAGIIPGGTPSVSERRDWP